MLRALIYIAVAWLLTAAVAALGAVFGLTIMLPSTSAVILVHLAFSHEDEIPYGLAVAIVIGYLEDLHQGAPIGTLSLAHGLTYLLLFWLSRRVVLPNAWSKMAAAGAFVLVVDLATWAILTVLAQPLGLQRDGLNLALTQVHWHVLATALMADPIWRVMDQLMWRLGLAPRPTPPAVPGATAAAGGEE